MKAGINSNPAMFNGTHAWEAISQESLVSFSSTLLSLELAVIAVVVAALVAVSAVGDNLV